MSQENVETARRCLDALNRRDVEGYIACCTDDVELRTATVALEGAYVGAEGIRRFFYDIQDTAPDFHLEIERLEAVGPDRVLGFARGTVSGRSSGVTLDEGIPFGDVWDFADGKVSRIEVFTDRQEALEAVGLRE
jgi:ketosteroid isomerase-like protein